MNKDFFEIRVDSKGRQYAAPSNTELEKNHTGLDAKDPDVSSDKTMYELPQYGDRCPLSVLEQYLSHLNPNCLMFWQRAKKYAPDGDVWYDDMPVGANTLGNKLKTFSDRFNLSEKYTNHCVRATVTTVLDQGGVEGRHIIGVTGHRNTDSLKSYINTVSKDKRHSMGNILGAFGKDIVREPLQSITNLTLDDPAPVSRPSHPASVVQQVAPHRLTFLITITKLMSMSL